MWDRDRYILFRQVEYHCRVYGICVWIDDLIGGTFRACSLEVSIVV